MSGGDHVHRKTHENSTFCLWPFVPASSFGYKKAQRDCQRVNLNQFNIPELTPQFEQFFGILTESLVALKFHTISPCWNFLNMICHVWSCLHARCIFLFVIGHGWYQSGWISQVIPGCKKYMILHYTGNTCENPLGTLQSVSCLLYYTFACFCKSLDRKSDPSWP